MNTDKNKGIPLRECMKLFKPVSVYNVFFFVVLCICTTFIYCFFFSLNFMCPYIREIVIVKIWSPINFFLFLHYCDLEYSQAIVLLAL